MSDINFQESYPRSSRQVVGLDLLRLFAAVLVMAYHFGFWHFTRVDAMFIDRLSTSTSNVTSPLTHFGWIGVEIFFVISGFVIAYSTEGATTAIFIRGRIMRLVPAVWICAPFTAIIYITILHKGLPEIAPQLLRTITFFPMFSQIDGVYWTLGIEVSFYALVAFLFANGAIEKIGAVAAWLGFASLAFWIAIYICIALTEPKFTGLTYLRIWVLKVEGFRPFQLLLLQHGCLFALGVYMWLGLIKKMTLARSGFMALMVAACLLEITAQNGIIERASGQELSSIPAIITWLICMLFFAVSVVSNNYLQGLSPRFTKLARSAGLLTYPLYLIHNSVGVAVILALSAVGLPDAPALLFGGLAAIAVASSVSIWFEPSLSTLLKGLKFKNVKLT